MVGVARRRLSGGASPDCRSGDRIVELDGVAVTTAQSSSTAFTDRWARQLDLVYLRDGVRNEVFVDARSVPRIARQEVGLHRLFTGAAAYERVGRRGGGAPDRSRVSPTSPIRRVGSIVLLVTHFTQVRAADFRRHRHGSSRDDDRRTGAGVRTCGWPRRSRSRSGSSICCRFRRSTADARAFIVAEIVRGKPVDPEKEAMVHVAGFAALMALMLLVAFHDIARIASGQWGNVSDSAAPRAASRSSCRTRPAKSDAKSVWIGGDHPIVVQSMTTTDTADADKTLEQIYGLTMEGCEVVRVTVEGPARCRGLARDRPPFAGADRCRHSLRSQDGAGRDRSWRREVASQSRQHPRPEEDRRGRHRGEGARDSDSRRRQHGFARAAISRKRWATRAEAMVESALRHVEMLEEHGHTDIAISLKAHDVLTTVRRVPPDGSAVCASAERRTRCTSGITEAGLLRDGTIKSSIGLGILLFEGIGDTLRVSLADDPVEEIPVCWGILKSLGLREKGFEITACPSCGRAEISVLELGRAVEAIASRTPLR